MDTTKKSTISEALLIGLKLLLICSVIAGIVSFVYALTADTYAENIKRTQELAVGKIFTGEENRRMPYTELGESDGVIVSAVYDDNTLFGFCAEVTVGGFGGDISLMVGYDCNGTIIGVNIVSHSETPGLGSKSSDANYLNGNYSGKSGILTAGEEVDMIAGASVTSKAVLDGVNRATAAVAECALKEDNVHE